MRLHAKWREARLNSLMARFKGEYPAVRLIISSVEEEEDGTVNFNVRSCDDDQMSITHAEKRNPD
jgi:hypothetical protein